MVKGKTQVSQPATLYRVISHFYDFTRYNGCLRGVRIAPNTFGRNENVKTAILLVAALSLTGPTFADTATAPTTNAGWRVVAQYNGRCCKNTPPFHVGSHWRIKWKAVNGTAQTTNFIIDLHTLKPNPIPAVIVNDTGNSEGETDEYNGGDYYLEINSADDYAITIADCSPPAKTVKGIDDSSGLSWCTVATFSGSENKNTPSFHVGKHWRVLFDTTSQGNDNTSFTAFVQKPGAVIATDTIGLVSGNCTDVSDIYREGEYYLNINSTQPYTVTVQDLGDANKSANASLTSDPPLPSINAPSVEPTVANSSTVTAQLPEQRAYSIVAIDPTAQKLPTNYIGQDPKSCFVNIVDHFALQKGEFETTADYNARLAKADTVPVIGNLMPSDVYAFKIDDSVPEFQYDADKQVLHIGFSNQGWGTQSSWGDGGLLLKQVPQSLDTYTGTNAMGAQVTVAAAKTILLELHVINQKRFKFKAKDYGMSGYSVEDLNMPSDIAKLVKPSLGILAVGHLSRQKTGYVSTQDDHSEPTFSNPTDITITHDQINMSVDEFLIYNVVTGDVYSTITPR